MAKIGSGKTGSITAGTGWGASVVANSVQNWEAHADKGENDITSFGSAGVYECSPGVLKITGSFEMVADDTTVINLSDTAAALVLNYPGAARKLSGNAHVFVVDLGADGQTGKAPIVKFNFTFTGAVTIA